MALLKTSQAGIDISGRFCGAIAARDSAGLHLRTPHRTISSRSQIQKRRQRAYRACLVWREQNITTNHIAAWLLWAKQLPSKNRLSETIVLTWWNAFLKINLVRSYNNLPILEYPPE